MIREVLEGLPGQARAYNQAVMELGATLCGPNSLPECGACPLREICLGYRRGCAADLPVKAPKKPRRIEERTVFLLMAEGRAAIRRRPKTGLLAGLWELPSAEGALSPEETRASLREWGVEAVKLQPLRPAKHIFSHVEWHMTGYAVRLSGWCEEEGPPAQPLVWATRRELETQYAIPSAYKAYYEMLLQLLDAE